MDLAKRIDRVRRPVAVDLDRTDLEPVVVAGGGEPAHLEAMDATRLVLHLLVRRDPGRHQQHPFEGELRARLARADQVREVRRVERPAEDPDRRQLRTCPSPSTRYLHAHSSRRPIGPRACSFCVELPISAPIPNSPPSVKRVEALT